MRHGVALLMALLLAACESGTMSTQTPSVQERGELRVATLNGPTSYYLGAHGPEGLEYVLAQRFAKELGIKLLIQPVRQRETLRSAVMRGDADIAAAALPYDGVQPGGVLASLAYARVPQIIVFRRGAVRPNVPNELRGGRLVVKVGSVQEKLLINYRDSHLADLSWLTLSARQLDPVHAVHAGEADYALLDAREFSFSKHLYPYAVIAFEWPQTRKLHWWMNTTAPDLKKQVDQFFLKLQRSGELAKLLQQTSGDAREFAYLESREFQLHLRTRLRLYRAWFEQAARAYNFDWRLLSAMGYQESKWDLEAVSPNGAAGIMMLMTDTAAAMTVSDRHDPRQSIFGGAAYLSEVRKKIPERIAEPDRTWFAVAAYNVGYGHLEDARVLTQSQGKNPDAWTDVREYLPLLAEENWYTQAKHGYARGWEPVEFVARVQAFLNLLEWQSSNL
jgi:membrane-bound lytic murein transglycosylase F